jgi:rhodanese-related sulfurtransferase
LPKQIYPPDTPQQLPAPLGQIPSISPQKLQLALNSDRAPLLVDIREFTEFKKGHIAQAQSVPLPEIFTHPSTLSQDRNIVLVCRGGWRSQRAVLFLQEHGYKNITMLQGGMLAWLSAGFSEEIEYVTD